MTLLELPNEILLFIVNYTIPEGFENLTLTSKKLYTICCPFLAEHNKNTKHFRQFAYHTRRREINEHPFRFAIDLILHIADNPLIARYIQSADFSFDSQVWTRGLRLQHVPSKKEYAVLENLLATSAYIKQAGIDHRQYLALIKDVHGEDNHEDPGRRRLRDFRSYSQHAAAFLLTLLPNVKNLRLPSLWDSSEESDKLVDTIARVARSSNGNSSLGFVETLEEPAHPGPRSGRPRPRLDQLSPFMALPNLTDYDGYCHIDQRSLPMRFAPYTMLSRVNLEQCHIDHEAIGRFLRCVPNLRSLGYVHSHGNGHVSDWDVSKFIYAIAECAGAILEELSVTVWRIWESGAHNDQYASRVISTIIPDLMIGFQRLQKLTFPLEIVPNFGGNIEQDHSDKPLNLRTLVPVSVQELSIFSDNPPAHIQAMNSLLQAIASIGPDNHSTIQQLYICVEGIYETEYAAILQEIKDLGITVQWDTR